MAGGHASGACVVGACMVEGGGREVCGRGTCMAGGYAWWGACMAVEACIAGEMATAVDGTHPTEMHSCITF